MRLRNMLKLCLVFCKSEPRYARYACKKTCTASPLPNVTPAEDLAVVACHLQSTYFSDLDRNKIMLYVKVNLRTFKKTKHN